MRSMSGHLRRPRLLPRGLPDEAVTAQSLLLLEGERDPSGLGAEAAIDPDLPAALLHLLLPLLDACAVLRVVPGVVLGVRGLHAVPVPGGKRELRGLRGGRLRLRLWLATLVVRGRGVLAPSAVRGAAQLALVALHGRPRVGALVAVSLHADDLLDRLDGQLRARRLVVLGAAAGGASPAASGRPAAAGHSRGGHPSLDPRDEVRAGAGGGVVVAVPGLDEGLAGLAVGFVVEPPDGALGGLGGLLVAADGDVDADALGVHAGAVGADVGPASALVDLAVLPDHEVVTSPAPSVGEVDRFDVLRDPRAGGLRGRTAVVVDEEVCAGREGRAVRRPSPRLGAPA